MASRFTWRFVAHLLVLMCSAWPVQHALAAPPPPAQAFFEPPNFSDPLLSPQGDKVAFKLKGDDAFARLVVLDLKTQQPKVVASYDDVSIGEVHWVNNDRLVYNLAVWLLPSAEISFNRGLFAVNADGSQYRQLAETVGAWAKDSLQQKLLPQWTQYLRRSAQADLPDIWVVVTEAYDKANGADFHRIHRLNTLTGRSSELDTPLHASDWVFDQKDELRAASTVRNGRHTVEYRDPGGPWRVLTEGAALESDIFPLLIDADDHLYVSSSQRGGYMGVYRWDFAAGRPQSEPLAHVPGFDLAPQFLMRQGQIQGLRLNVDATLTQWLDKDVQALQSALDRALPATVNLLSLPQAGDSPYVLVHRYSDRNPGSTLVFNRETKKFTRLGDARPALKDAPQGEMDFVRIKARDGGDIPSYITRAPGTSQTPGPMVVLVHGGPWLRGGDWRWDAEVQFLASRGYAVLQPEFRGSTGFGSAHFSAGWKQWGQAMQDDVTDATRWAIEKGIADPRRICIMGASYGGYATMMGLIREPDLYRCGVNWVGPSDPMLLYTVQWSDMTDAAKEHGLSKLLGDPHTDADMLRAQSPLQLAARLKAPLLMAYGGKDERVPLAHGEKMRDALKPHQPDLEWVLYRQAGHGWNDQETRVDFWSRVERFLAKHLGTK